jgi:hypothetical protein
MHPVSFDNNSHLRSPGSPIFWPGKTSPSSGLAEPKPPGRTGLPVGWMALLGWKTHLWHYGTPLFSNLQMPGCLVQFPIIPVWEAADWATPPVGSDWGSRSTTSAFTKAAEETLPGAPGAPGIPRKESHPQRDRWIQCDFLPTFLTEHDHGKRTYR